MNRLILLMLLLLTGMVGTLQSVHASTAILSSYEIVGDTNQLSDEPQFSECICQSGNELASPVQPVDAIPAGTSNLPPTSPYALHLIRAPPSFR